MKISKLSGYRKKCPKCRQRIAVEVSVCACGYSFRKTDPVKDYSVGVEKILEQLIQGTSEVDDLPMEI